ncbi:MAG: hypothetical protein J4F49_12305 [Rhodobacteraceae bacterium]|nr:hypothetical protein [Paracoccaceae bacterium]
MSENDPKFLAIRTSNRLRKLSPGALARLRRMPEDGAVPEFWRLGLPESCKWVVIARILAILTDRGEPELRGSLHDESKHFGELLCDGGQATWTANDRPLLSELRLAQLLAARDTVRHVLMIRAVQALRAKHSSSLSVNVADIALAVLKPEKNEVIAKPYYQRLDRDIFDKREPQSDD